MLVVLAGALLPGVVQAATSDGSLDTDFDGDGKLTTDFDSADDAAESVALQPDGKIVAAGGSSNGSGRDFGLARYDADGSLDTSFDTDGKVTTDFGSSTEDAYSVAMQPDGKIVVAGKSYQDITDYDFALARYNANGSLDMSFDTDGKVTTDFGSSFPADFAGSVAVQPDGKIVVAGYSHNGSDYDFALARYKANGSLDTSFDTDGKLTTDLDSSNDSGHSVALQPDGKIVVAGDSHDGSNYDFALARYNANGSLDGSFGVEGKVTTTIGPDAEARSVALQPDGKIVLAGGSNDGSNYDFALARYNANGALDPRFDGDGKVKTDFDSSAEGAASVALQPDGRIVAAGSSHKGSELDFALARYNANGSLDVSFDGDGKVKTDLGSDQDVASSAALQSDGQIVVAGETNNGSPNYDFALARYNVAVHEHERSITLTIKHVKVNGKRMLKLSGELSVADTASKCIQNKRVYVERYKNKDDGWVKVGDVVTAGNGRYSHKAPDTKARYRARVKVQWVTYDGLKNKCLAASAARRHRH